MNDPVKVGEGPLLTVQVDDTAGVKARLELWLWLAVRVRFPSLVSVRDRVREIE